MSTTPSRQARPPSPGNLSRNGNSPSLSTTRSATTTKNKFEDKTVNEIIEYVQKTHIPWDSAMKEMARIECLKEKNDETRSNMSSVSCYSIAKSVASTAKTGVSTVTANGLRKGRLGMLPLRASSANPEQQQQQDLSGLITIHGSSNSARPPLPISSSTNFDTSFQQQQNHQQTRSAGVNRSTPYKASPPPPPPAPKQQQQQQQQFQMISTSATNATPGSTVMKNLVLQEQQQQQIQQIQKRTPSIASNSSRKSTTNNITQTPLQNSSRFQHSFQNTSSTSLPPVSNNNGGGGGFQFFVAGTNNLQTFQSQQQQNNSMTMMSAARPSNVMKGKVLTGSRASSNTSTRK